jgi:glycosyltransferase involved in cell wall biosynthesis
MMFSLIIPYHSSASQNRNAMLDELLGSVPDREDLEVILIDDHSDIPWAGENPFVKTKLHHLPNHPGQKYAGTARNVGLDFATGTYVLFADSDDLFDTRAIESVFNKARSLPCKDMILFGTSSFVSGEGTSARHIPFEKVCAEFQKTGDLSLLLRLHPPHGRLVSRDLVKIYGLQFEGTRVGNDVSFGVLVGFHCRDVVVFEDVAYLIREHEVSLTTDLSEEAIRERMGVFFRVNKFLRKNDHPMRFTSFGYLHRFARKSPKFFIRMLAWSLFQDGSVLITRSQIKRGLAKSLGSGGRG